MGLYLKQRCILIDITKQNSVAFSPQANYTDRATAAVGEISANFSG
jgi:hypothetical protein